MNKIPLIPGIPMEGPMTLPPPEGVLRNDTGSNTSFPPHPPVRCSAVFADGKEDTWLEYVPENLPERPALVISCHGGGVNGAMQFEETSWWCIAEKEGLIAVFPDAGGQSRSWLAEYTPPKSGDRSDMLEIFKATDDGRASEENHHIKFIKALIEEMKKKYNIDESRIYMQGMSMGDIMTMMFSRVCGNLLAAADSTAGPSPEVALFNEDGSIRGYRCPVPIYQVRGELDDIAVAVPEGRENYTRQDINAANRKFWLQVNECCELPRLAIRGVNNFAFYTGKQANVVYRDVKHRGHGQTLDDAQWAWETLFKGARRNPDGSVTCRDTAFTATGDEGAVAVCEGAQYIYVNNKKVRMEAPAKVDVLSNFNFATHKPEPIKEDIYVPVTALEAIFGAEVQLTQEGKGAVIIADGEVLEVAQESVLCLRDGFVESMYMPARNKDGLLYVNLRWFAEMVYNRFVTQCNGAMYISDHPGEMTKDMAYIIKEILM